MWHTKRVQYRHRTWYPGKSYKALENIQKRNAMSWKWRNLIFHMIPCVLVCWLSCHNELVGKTPLTGNTSSFRVHMSKLAIVKRRIWNQFSSITCIQVSIKHNWSKLKQSVSSIKKGTTTKPTNKRESAGFYTIEFVLIFVLRIILFLHRKSS